MNAAARGRAVAIAAVAVAGAAVGTVGKAAAFPYGEEQHIAVYCQPATGQECPQTGEMKEFHSRPMLGAAQYTADANGCSDVFVRLSAGDLHTDWQRISPGQTTVPFRFVKSGDFVITVAAKGIVGGCNTGILQSWGGTLRYDYDDPTPAPPETNFPSLGPPAAPQP